MYRRQSDLIKFKHFNNYLIFLSTVTVLFTNCAVSPLLESPRVHSGVKIEASVKHTKSQLTWNLSDSIMHNSLYSNELTFVFGGENVELAPLVRFGIANRVEFGGYIWGVIQNMGWDGRIKVALFEIGKPLIFRNVASAAIIGSNKFSGEWDKSQRNWGGISLGTYHKFGRLGIEYILMPTAGKTSYRNRVDGLGSVGVYFYDITLATGINADINNKFYSSFSLTAMKKFTSHYDIKDYITINRITFSQEPIGFNLIIGYRFGSRKD